MYFEKALSDRAICTICKQPIGMGETKMGFINTEHRFAISNHFDCFLRENTIDFSTNKIAYADDIYPTSKERGQLLKAI